MLNTGDRMTVSSVQQHFYDTYDNSLGHNRLILNKECAGCGTTIFRVDHLRDIFATAIPSIVDTVKYFIDIYNMSGIQQKIYYNTTDKATEHFYNLYFRTLGDVLSLSVFINNTSSIVPISRGIRWSSEPAHTVHYNYINSILSLFTYTSMNKIISNLTSVVLKSMFKSMFGYEIHACLDALSSDLEEQVREEVLDTIPTSHDTYFSIGEGSIEQEEIPGKRGIIKYINRDNNKFIYGLTDSYLTYRDRDSVLKANCLGCESFYRCFKRNHMPCSNNDLDYIAENKDVVIDNVLEWKSY
jgi:hypothetical protein